MTASIRPSRSSFKIWQTNGYPKSVPDEKKTTHSLDPEEEVALDAFEGVSNGRDGADDSAEL